MIQRSLESPLRAGAKAYPILTLTGPRQSGKTTLARSLFNRHAYVSLENPDERAFALEDPRGFLNRFESGVILDEIQQAPDLFSYIQGIVDDDDRTGRFILTGSQNFLLLERVSQSLAGRSAILHLLPFSRAELTGRKALPLCDVGRDSPNSREDAASALSVYEMLFTGFYPRIHDKNLDPHDWLANYYQTYVERDVRSITNVGDIETFGRFMRLCAGRCGQLLNVSSLASDTGVSHPTARRWLSILEASFIVYLLRPHHRNFSKRLVKSPKLYFYDTGLLSYLLRIRTPEDMIAHPARGAIFETFVVGEVLKAYYHSGTAPDAYFWRDISGHEIDLVLDHGRELTPVEVKSGETVPSDFSRGIDYWRSLPGQTDVPAALVYGGDKTYRRNNIILYSWKDWL